MPLDKVCHNLSEMLEAPTPRARAASPLADPKIRREIDDLVVRLEQRKKDKDLMQEAFLYDVQESYTKNA